MKSHARRSSSVFAAIAQATAFLLEPPLQRRTSPMMSLFFEMYSVPSSVCMLVSALRQSSSLGLLHAVPRAIATINPKLVMTCFTVKLYPQSKKRTRPCDRSTGVGCLSRMDARTERFRRLLEPIHDRVLTFSRGLCKSAADGDDLFQESALRAFTKLDALREDGAFRTWLFRIVITVHRKRARRAFWRRFLPLGDGPDGGNDDDASPAASGERDYRVSAWSPDAGDATARARAALATLPADQREAIVLFEMEGWQVDEIAQLQNVTASAVKSRLARGRDRLRAYYERELGTTPASPVLNGETP
jgi:RNA polymerase sigma factor (sigma-70 family)